MDIGIDLGTTFSVIAVKGKMQLTEGYPPPLYLPECDVTIIPTPEGDYTFPSVFWVDLDDPEFPVIGIEAVQKAEEGLSPIMFSKRSIGTDEALKINDRTFTAKEVATHILRYLKSCAEKALGEPINRAVVTHPAYFDRNQIQETKDAAIAAGFDMSCPEQVMMEPVAAALAYMQGDIRDPLRVMTYDLGGGTFDVTILERSQGVTTMKGFDGDHLLGGYNFDRELVQWILGRLSEAGRVIPYDENNPEDRGRRARLLQLAESIKIKLTEQRSSKVYVPIKAPDILIDSNGKKVQILDRINREEYAKLIKEHLDRTIDCCYRALAKAKMDAKDLDAVLLVGGSTYGQWVIEAVQDAFSVEVEPYNPDLCVAAGAAIQAAELPPIGHGLGIKVIMDLQPWSELSFINIAGKVKADDGSDLDESNRVGLKVLLTTPEGVTLEPCPLGQGGTFLFEDIELRKGKVNKLTIQVVDDEGRERFVETFSVKHVQEDDQRECVIASKDIEQVLPKPLYLETAEGLKPLAMEGDPLPARCEMIGKRLWSNSSLRINVWQEDKKVGEIVVNDIPEDAGEGCPVVVTVEITRNNEMRGTAKVLTRTGSVAVECPVHIIFPPIKLPTLSVLKAQFEELKAQREQLEILSDDPEYRLLLAGQGNNIIKMLEKLFNEMQPDVQEIHRSLKKLDHIVNPPLDDMDPPRAAFRRMIEECDQLLSVHGTDPQLQPLRTMLKNIEADGNDAFNTKNHKKWTIANENLVKLRNRIENIIRGPVEPGPPRQLPPTPILKDYFKMEVDQLRASLDAKRMELENRSDYESVLKVRCDDIERRIDQMDIAIDKVDDNLAPEQGLAKLQLAIRAKQRLQEEIRNVGHDIKDIRR